jgi:hypothetical protein
MPRVTKEWTVNKALHKFCINSAGLCVTFLGIAALLGHMFPWSFKPDDSAASVAAYYAAHHTRLQIGYTVGAFGACFVIPFMCAVAWEVQRMVGGWRTIAANIQLAYGVMFAMIGFFPYVFFLTATFLPPSDAGFIKLLTDLGFNAWEAPQGVALFHLTLFGIVILLDKREVRTFPKWVAYVSFATAFVDALGSFVAFQHSGPWAWNGVISAWVISIMWGVWLNAMMFYMNKAVDREWATPEAELYDIKLPGTPTPVSAVAAAAPPTTG